jgi:hypothetical protein
VASFLAPFGLTYDGAGRLFVFDKGRIRQVVIATGEVTTFAGGPTEGSADGVGPAASFGSQGDIASDGANALYVADMQNHAIRKIAVGTRSVTTVIGTASQSGLVLGVLPGGLVLPQVVATGPAGEIFIGDDDAVLVVR